MLIIFIKQRISLTVHNKGSLDLFNTWLTVHIKKKTKTNTIIRHFEIISLFIKK